jgi:phenylacetate-CoA ligase
MELTVERAEDTTLDHDELHERVLERLENVLAFTPDSLRIVDPGAIARTEVGKVQRVYDRRD